MNENKIDKMLDLDFEDRENKIHELIKERRALNVNKTEYENATFGERVSDMLAKFAGSWSFLISFMLLLLIYIGINTMALLGKNFDPFPFVFLNLVLGCVAAMQAPVIMMSQNREAKKDRIKADNEYLVNLKSEILLEDIHLKMDYLEEELREINTMLAMMQSKYK